MYNLMHTTTRYTVCMELAQKLSGKALTLTVQEMQETWVRSLHQEDPLGEEVATPSGTLAWKTPWSEEPGGLPSVGSHRVGHDYSDLTRAAADMQTTPPSWQKVKN